MAARPFRVSLALALVVLAALAVPGSTEASFLTEAKKLTASDAQPGDLFGVSVAVNGDTAVVGAHFEDAAGTNAGAAYVFQRNQGGADNWCEVKKLTASDSAADDHFGVSAAVSNDTAIVGAYFHPVESLSGAAYVFKRSQGGTDNWGEVTELAASDPQVQDLLGVSVSVSGDTAIAGAHFEDAGGDLAGAAYMFDLLLSKPTAAQTPTLALCAPEGCPTATPGPTPVQSGGAWSLRVEVSQ